ncbi:MAG: ketoacyl-ACP synthase III [Proteobacteria bacterium]|nr:ketoacyl-ACP synthase III [Pseudomonadota bacterium]
MTHRAFISAVGHYVPERIVTNSELSKLMTTSDEWIQTRSGIKERRFAADHEAPSDLGVHAALNAAKQARTGLNDVDAIICASLSPEHYFPGTSSFIQSKLGLVGVPSFDLRAQCSGFIYGLSVANAMVTSGEFKKVLLIGVEVHSRGLDFTDRGRDCAVLFGDGAGAVIIESCPSPEHGFLKTKISADGRFADKLWVEFPTMKRTPIMTQSDLEAGGLHPKMDGKFVFKTAVEKLPQVIDSTLSSINLQTKDIDLFLFHQANLRINEFVAATMNLDKAKIPSNIEKYGNCSAASIPILLSEQMQLGTVKRGDLICIAGFGSGFTWGCSVIRWF